VSPDVDREIPTGCRRGGVPGGDRITARRSFLGQLYSLLGNAEGRPPRGRISVLTDPERDGALPLPFLATGDRYPRSGARRGPRTFAGNVDGDGSRSSSGAKIRGWHAEGRLATRRRAWRCNTRLGGAPARSCD